MDVSRLLAVIYEVSDEYTEGYQAQLDQVISEYTQARDVPSTDRSNEIETARASLDEFLEASVVNNFVPSKIAILQETGLSAYFGSEGLHRLQEIMDRPGTGPATVVTALEAFKQEIEALDAAITNSVGGLTELKVDHDPLEGEAFEIGIAFPDSVTDNELGKLISQLRLWNIGIRAIYELTGDQRSEVAIRRTSSGSIEFYFLIGLAGADWVTRILERVIGIIERVQNIRRVKGEMESVELPPTAIKEADKKEGEILDSEVKTLVIQLLKESEIKGARKQELRKQLSDAIRLIAKLIDDGGVVEVSAPEQAEESFTPPTSDDGEPLSAEELQSAQDQWQALRKARADDLERIGARGATLAKLPRSAQPILGLPEPSGLDDDDNTKNEG